MNLNNIPPGNIPFDFGIKEFKRVLDRMNLSKSSRNKAIKMYKDRLYVRFKETKEKIESELMSSTTENVVEKGVCYAEDK